MSFLDGWLLLISIVSSSLLSCSPFNLTTLTIPQLHEKYQTSEWLVSNVTRCYLERIHHFNPLWNAIIKVNPSALREALILDKPAPDKFELMPLYGVPILIADNLATTDLMETSLGSPLLKYIKPYYEAQVLVQLRNAGAIILGKTNDAELSGFKYGLNQFGYSDEGGQVRDPTNITSKVTGGNLGMVAALVGNLGLAGISTTLNEVILGPNSIPNTLFSFSPSSKLISNQGIVPSNKNDKLAILANYLTDVILIANAISSRIKFKLPLPIELYLNETYTPTFNPIGIIKDSYYEQDVHNVISLLAPFRWLEYLGIPLKSVDLKVSNNLLLTNHFGFFATFKSSLSNYLRIKVVNNYNQLSYQDILYLNNDNPLLKPFSSYLQRTPHQDLDADQLFQYTRKSLMSQIKQLVSENNLSVLVILDGKRNTFSMLPKLLKLPFLTIPTHPISLTLMGLDGSSHNLIQLAANINHFFIHIYKPSA